MDASERGALLLYQGQFHIIGVQRRMADWSEDSAHNTWMRDYHFQNVRHVGASRIPFIERRGWSTTSGSRDLPGWKTRMGQQHVTNASKRKKTLTPLAMQDPRDTAKLRLLNSSFQRFVSWPSAITAYQCRDTGIPLLCFWVRGNALSGE